MRFKIDENLPGEIADDLRADGHDARTVADQGMGGAKDTGPVDCRGAVRNPNPLADSQV